MYIWEQGPIKELKDDDFLMVLSECDQTEVEKADRYEIWGSSFNDPGADFNELVLFKNNAEIYRKRIAGY